MGPSSCSCAHSPVLLSPSYRYKASPSSAQYSPGLSFPMATAHNPQLHFTSAGNHPVNHERVLARAKARRRSSQPGKGRTRARQEEDSGGEGASCPLARLPTRLRRVCRHPPNSAKDRRSPPVGHVGAFSFPWTTLTSPSSSDFDMVSDSEEVYHLDPAASGTKRHHEPIQPSNLSRSFSRSRNQQGDVQAAQHAISKYAGSVSGIGSEMGRRETPEREAKDADGDDEESAVEDSRGRGRTRQRRKWEEDPAARKSVVEEALRSRYVVCCPATTRTDRYTSCRSLATLLTLSAHPQTMSPAMSQASLTSLLSPSNRSPGTSSPLHTHSRADIFPRAPPFRPSPFAFALSESLADEPDEDVKTIEQELQDAQQWESNPSSSEAEPIDYSSSSDDGTQLAPHRRPSRAIPIPSSSRTGSQSSSLPTSATLFSPIQSRTLPLGPSSASPPTWSRRRRRRGQRRASVSPGPASIEERRRARAMTDAEDESVEVNHVFLELVDAAKTFMSMSPRMSGTTGSSSGTAGGRYGTGSLSPLPPVRIEQQWTPEADGIASPTSSFPFSDPVLASSVPTVDLSSGEDFVEPGAKARASVVSKGAYKGEAGGGKRWLGWLGGTVSLKVWHLIGLAGVLIGVGVGAGSVP